MSTEKKPAVSGETKSKPTAGEKREAASAAKAAKAEKAAAKAKNPAPPKVGVIAVIVEMLVRPEGASAAEIQAELIKRFPERDGEGMLTTVRIQITRLPKRFDLTLKKTKDETRGLVYKAPVALAKLYAKGGGNKEVRSGAAAPPVAESKTAVNEVPAGASESDDEEEEEIDEDEEETED